MHLTECMSSIQYQVWHKAGAQLTSSPKHRVHTEAGGPVMATERELKQWEELETCVLCTLQ